MIVYFESALSALTEQEYHQAWSNKWLPKFLTCYEAAIYITIQLKMVELLSQDDLLRRRERERWAGSLR